MQAVNPEQTKTQLKIKKNLNKNYFQNPIQYFQKNQLNNSLSKMQYTFSKSDRFNNSVNSFTPNKYYDLPQVLKTQRSSSFGYGKKVQFDKNGKLTPAPGTYQINRQFQGNNSTKGSTMGLSRQEIKFNQLFANRSHLNFPSPTSYNNLRQNHGSPKYTIGQKFNQKKQWIKLVPGPGNYEHVQPTSKLKSTISNFRNTPSAKFTKTLKLKQILSTNMLTPGPGNYNINQNTVKKQGTAFGKAQRLQKIQKNNVISPGPASQQPFIKNFSNMFSVFLH